MRKKQQLLVENVLQKLAQKEGKTPQQIKAEIRTALMEGLQNPDPGVQAYWKQIPCTGDIPTPEEVILHLSQRAHDSSK